MQNPKLLKLDQSFNLSVTVKRGKQKQLTEGEYGLPGIITECTEMMQQWSCIRGVIFKEKTFQVGGGSKKYL